MTSYPWYVRALLLDPDRVMANLARMRAAGVIDAEPNAWQLSLAVLRMWHRVMFRSETVGTSASTVRPTWRARVLEHRAARLPCLLASRAVIPLDFTGLRSSPARLIDHLIGAHHDGNQFVFDLELLTGHGALDELARRVRAILDGSDPRAAWLHDLAVYAGYHEALAAAVAVARATGPAMTAAEARDPDLTLRGLVAWCAGQPATPEATVAAWSEGRFRLDAPGECPPANRETLLAASRGQLAALMAASRPAEPRQLAGWAFRGTSLGLPAWVDRITWKTFGKSFVTDGAGVRGWNVRIDQRDPWSWTPRMRRGGPDTFGPFDVIREGKTTLLRYGRLLRDPLVALDDTGDRLLGMSLVDLGGVRLPTPSYFLLERGQPIGQAVTTASRRSVST
jgi:hypothetical protein